MSNQPKGRSGGVLPIPAAATKKSNVPQKSSQRSPAPKLRLIIRRLPPGLTATEFWDAIGAEWQVGNGKVDWQAFKEGKISRDPSKPSRPGRAYLKVKDQSLLEALSAKVKATQFKDAKNTINDPCLVGPPSLEFAPYTKIPSGRNRHDGRQGTIDQDQEFIDFLQSLTEPIVKPTVNGTDNADSKQEKVSITPLVQFIKEKKANKAKEKEAAAAKSSKKNQDGKEGKAKGETRQTVVVKSNAATDKAKVAKATQEAVKAANKAAAQIQSKTATPKPEPKPAKEVTALAGPAATTPTPTKPERQRGNASAASRMIARDLGLAPKEPRTPRAAKNAGTASTPTTETKTKAEQSSTSTPATTTTTTTSKPAANVPTAPAAQSAPTPPTGPRNQKPNQTPQPKQTQPAAQRSSKAPPQPTPGAKSAFLKHANPSQGVTEDLLRTTFSTYGEVIRCEIDKKKGLGYVDFTDTESLKKAMAASPVKIGNGQVVVLENRSPYQKRQAQPSNATQQSGSGVNTSRAASVASSAVPSAVTSPQPALAIIATAEPNAVTTAASATEPTPATEPTISASAPVTPTTPNTPKGARGGNSAARGQRGGAGFPAGRGGGFNQNPNRGRGGFRNRGGRGGRGAANAATGAAGTGTNSAPTTPVTATASTSAAGSEGAKPAAAEGNKV